MSASKIKVSFGQGEKPRLNFIGSNFRWCIPVRDQSGCDSGLKRPGEYSSSLGSAFPRNSKGPLFGGKEYSHSGKRKRKQHPHAFGHGGETRLTGSDGLLPAVHGIDGDALGFLQPFGPEAILQPPAGERRGVGFGKTQTEQVQKISPVFRSQVSEAVAYNLHHRSQGKLPVKTSRNARVDGQVIPPLHQRARQPVGGSRHTDSG